MHARTRVDMQERETAGSDEARRALVLEQAQFLCRNQLSSLPMSCVLAIAVAMSLQAEVGGPLLWSWLGAVLLTNLARISYAAWHRKPEMDSGVNLRTLVFGALVSGLTWSIVPAAMFTMASPHASVVVFTLCGLTAGATIQSSSVSESALAFVVPIMGMVAIKCLWTGGDGASVLTVSTLLYLWLILNASRKGEAAFVKTVMLTWEAKASAMHLHRLANHDPLTGLANRTAFSIQLEAALMAAREQVSPFGLFLLDLDHFKSVNDTLGHSAGDEVLKETATRLAAALGGDHVVARLGGDEFVVLFRSGAARAVGRSEHVAAAVADRILDAVSGVVHVGDHPVSIGLSIGVAMFPEDGETADDLLAHADLALYAAKDGGRNGWRRFDSALLAEATMSRDLDHDLPVALADGSLQVFYQPQIALLDRRVTGLEALLRWRHPVHGWIPPPSIVVAARRTRRSEALTGYVLDDACRRIHRLSDTGQSGIVVAVNVSPSELDQYDLPGLVQRSIERHGIAPGQLELEITEEAFAASDKALATLSALSAMGVRLAIDDFGAGCSALAYLRSMKVDRIKIDRSFVTGLSGRAGDRILVQAILGIGRSFGIEVLAEGVESIEEVLLLQSFGCGVVQGYFFARPLSPKDVEDWLLAHASSQQEQVSNNAAA